MSYIINDSALDELLKEEGFAVLPILDQLEVESLLKYYAQHHPDSADGMYASAHSDDITYRKRMNAKLTETIVPKARQILGPVQFLGSSFIVKGQSPQGYLPPHQDWNIVDERSYRSFNLWIPLVDTSDNNGGIMVLPKSHLWDEIYRGPNISSAFEHVVDELWPLMVTLNIPAGHGLLYDHRLLHASGTNSSGEARVVVVMGIIEETAQMKFYYRNSGRVEEYNCDESFYLEGNPQNGPEGLEMTNSVAWHYPSFGRKSLKRFLRLEREEQSWKTRIAQFLNLKQ